MTVSVFQNSPAAQQKSFHVLNDLVVERELRMMTDQFAAYTDNVEIMNGIWEAFRDHLKGWLRECCPATHFDHDFGRSERLILENLCDKKLFCDFEMVGDFGKLTFGFQIHGNQEGQYINVKSREIYFDQGGNGFIDPENIDEAFSLVGAEASSLEILSDTIEHTIRSALNTPHQYMTAANAEQSSAPQGHLMDSLLQEV
jgi:hypothetical protein